METLLLYLNDLIQSLFGRFDRDDLVVAAIVLSINIIVLFFSKSIARYFSIHNERIDKRTQRLRFMNLLLFCLYFIPLFLPEVASKISKTALVLLVGYAAVHFFRILMLQKFGAEKDMEGETVRAETYQSEMFNLLVLLIVLLGCFLTIVNIWNITDWLKTTSVVGGLLLVTYSTKDVWAPENIHGLILLYKGDVEPGSVVRVEELQLLAVVKEVQLTQIVFRDLRHRHTIILPNSRFRNAKVEILNNATGRGLVEFMDFKIGYGFKSKEIETFLVKVWERAQASESAIEASVKPRIRLQENGDHAVTWRLFFNIGNVYKLLGARCAINLAAYDLSLEMGIGLNTPYTHQVEQTRIPAPSEDNNTGYEP